MLSFLLGQHADAGLQGVKFSGWLGESGHYQREGGGIKVVTQTGRGRGVRRSEGRAAGDNVKG
jgi:hypothetical protein